MEGSLEADKLGLIFMIKCCLTNRTFLIDRDEEINQLQNYILSIY